MSNTPFPAKRTIRIGTRSSPLALAQAYETRERLMKAHDLAMNRFQIVKKTSAGDRIQDQSLSEFGGKGLFTKEIEDALLADEIDVAVHSMKDVATQLPGGLVIPCLLAREDVRDAFISLKYKSLADLPKGAVVGSSSLRRQSQVKNRRPDLQLVEFRGNVQTRLQKLQDGVADATFLAHAGLRRLGYEDKISSLIETEEMLPAVAQGAIGLQIRQNDSDMAALIAPLNDPASLICVFMERAFLRRLDGSCRTPIAGLARLDGETIHFRGQILSTDGKQSFEASRTCALEAAEQIAVDVAEQLLEQAGPGFLATTS